MLNELIPNIDDRLDFINKYEMFISNKENNVSLIYLSICRNVGNNNISIIPKIPTKKINEFTCNDTSDSENTLIVIEDKREQPSCSSQEEYFKEMPDFNLTELLEQTPMGKAILSYYNNNNHLNNCLKN
ncbi:hypothetical protein PUN28_008295 [Cardiocondyla obscurior]|uniref:Uncharacterized protein n=1 Tax=Cardiocondyla obscurior TaxID=286306 RepID=A0AAW2FZF1_9HYME